MSNDAYMDFKNLNWATRDGKGIAGCYSGKPTCLCCGKPAKMFYMGIDMIDLCKKCYDKEGVE